MFAILQCISKLASWMINIGNQSSVVNGRNTQWSDLRLYPYFLGCHTNNIKMSHISDEHLSRYDLPSKKNWLWSQDNISHAGKHEYLLNYSMPITYNPSLDWLEFLKDIDLEHVSLYYYGFLWRGHYKCPQVLSYIIILT